MTRFQASILVGATLALLATVGCSRNAAYYFERGKAFTAQGKQEEAVVNLQKALQKDPRMGAAYLELGATYIKLQKGPDAFRALEQAVRLLPGNEDASRQLADLALMGYTADPNRPKFLYDRIDTLSQQMLARNPESFDGHRLRGDLAMFDRKPSQALEHFRKANEVRPGDARVVQALTQALFQVNQPDEAEKTALQLVDQQKDFGPIYDVLYRYYQTAQRAQEAEQLLVTKAANNPKNIWFALELAAHYARMKKTDRMNATLQRLLDNPADFPEARLLVGDLYVALGDSERARQYYEEGAKNRPSDKVAYQKRLAALLTAQGKGDQALPLLEEILKAKPDDAPSRAARAGLLLEKPSAAERDLAVQEFQALVAKDPKNSVLHYALGRALVATGKPEEARKQFREAVDRAPNSPAPRFARANLALQRGDYREALTEAEEILKRRPDDPRARLLHATAQAGLGALAEASQELRRLLTDMPNFIDADLQLGNVYLSQRKLTEAEAIFRKHMKPGAASFRATEGLAQCLELRNEPQKAIDLLKTEIAQTPDRTPARLALADIALRAKQYPAAIEQYKALIAQDPKSASLQQLLARAYELSGDRAGALAALQSATQIEPGNAPALLLLGQLLEAAGREQEAVSVYRRLVAARPTDAVALNNLAFALSETGGDLDDALALAQRARAILSDNPTVADTMGWIYLKKNMPSAALQIFRNLVAKNPDNATYRYHLGAALMLEGAKAAAKSELETALRKSPSKQEELQIRDLLAKA